MGRHTPEEIVALGTRSLDAAATFLAEKPFMMSAEPTGLDATVFAFVVGGLCPSFETPLLRRGRRPSAISSAMSDAWPSDSFRSDGDRSLGRLRSSYQ